MKWRFLAAVAASALLVTLSAPAAFGQAIIEDDEDETNTNVQIVDCSQVQSAFASQGQYANANAVARDSEATAEVAQELGITQDQVNNCLGDGADNKAKDPADGKTLPEGKDEVIDETVQAAKLPETGGPSLLLIGGGLAVVAGALALIRRR